MCGIFTRFIGRYGLIVTSIIFVGGVLISTSSPSWVETHTTLGGGTTVLETQFGPFFSRNRTCMTTASGQVANETSDCNDWTTGGIEADDCQMFVGTDAQYTPEVEDKLCQQFTAWRVLAEMCVLIVVGTGIFVAVATLTQCITCGCCGGSFQLIAMWLCWLEVILSIAAWSLVISTVSMMRNEDILTVLQEEGNAVYDATAAAISSENAMAMEAVYTEGYFLWGFWLFMVCGTVFGIFSAILADWASDGSLLKCVSNILCCCFK